MRKEALIKYYISTIEFNCRIDLHNRQAYVCVMNPGLTVKSPLDA